MVSSRFQQVITGNGANDLERNLAEQASSPTGFLRRVPSYGSEVDWVEPSLPLCNASLLKPFGSDRLYDAFHLLQTEPHVQVSPQFMLHIDRLSHLYNINLFLMVNGMKPRKSMNDCNLKIQSNPNYWLLLVNGHSYVHLFQTVGFIGRVRLFN